MDKKILEKVSFNLDNSVLQNAIADYIASKKNLNKLQELVKIFESTEVIVPVSFPKNVDKNIIKKMLQGERLKKDEAIPMLPITLSDQKGNKFAPAFTSKDQILETKDFPFLIKVPAKQVIKTALNEKLGLNGILLNPQTSGFLFRKKAFIDDLAKVAEQQSQRQKIKKVSKEEFVVLARNSVEKSLIPKLLFEGKSEFVKKLDEQREAFLQELYNKPYGDKLPNPYTAEDFSVMVLDIDEETTAICIELPQKNVIPQLSLSAYIIWNPQTEEVYYYMIEKGQPEEDNVLCNVTPEGRHQELMTAPPVGSELSAVLDLIREEKEEEN